MDGGEVARGFDRAKRHQRELLPRQLLLELGLQADEAHALRIEGKRERQRLDVDVHARAIDAGARGGRGLDRLLRALVLAERAVDVEVDGVVLLAQGLRHRRVVVHRGDLVLDAVAAGEGGGDHRENRCEEQGEEGALHGQCPPCDWGFAPAGCLSYHSKYSRYCLISASVRLWFGIGILLNSFSIAFASASVCSIFSGSFSQRVSQSTLRCLVTPARSGPSFFPWPIEWQARHLDWNASCPLTASGSVGLASTEAMLWCSRSLAGALAAVEIRPIAPCEALAKWWSTMM